MSTRIRTLDILHVYWVPLIPLGLWSRWRCTVCQERPHARNRTRQEFKIVGTIFILVPMVLASWWFLVIGVPEDIPEEEIGPGMVWVMALVSPALLALGIWSIVKHKPEPNFEERLAVVMPYDGPYCLLCGGVLSLGPPERCTECGARHLPL